MSENEQENENRETVADIVTEMRERADAMQTHGTTHGVRLAVLEFARRIEAAWKRESKAIATENAVLPAVCITKPSGNAAAMREALVAMVEAETEGSIDRDDLCGRCFEKMWNRCKHDGSCWVDKVINALSAPARNCDRFTSIEEARTAYCSECERMISIWDGNESWLFEEWLFAPATERKGDGDAI